MLPHFATFLVVQPTAASYVDRGPIQKTGIYQMRFSKMAMAAASLMLSTQIVAAQDVAEGEKLFRQRCQSCHSVIPGKNSPAGPSLIAVVGRASGSTDFRYSTAMKEAGLTWDAATLDLFLAAPSKLVPGTRMSIAVPNPEQRNAIIEYLASVKN